VDALAEDDILLITADHGNDPSTASTDHSRERTPLLATGASVAPGVDVGQRDSFTDVAATVAELLGVPTATPGRSFAPAVLA
jgi:phosphopentomutase